MTAITYGILGHFVAQIGKDADFAELLDEGYLISEVHNMQWFTAKYDNVEPTTTSTTFPLFIIDIESQAADLDDDDDDDQEGIDQVLIPPLEISPKVARLLVPEPFHICKVEVLASKVDNVVVEASDKKAGLSVGLKVLIEAKPEKVQTVRDFLTNALPLVNAESLTPLWYALHRAGTTTFYIFDFFTSEAGRDAHLAGKVAAALFASVDELLTGFPEVIKVDIVNAKITG